MRNAFPVIAMTAAALTFVGCGTSAEKPRHVATSHGPVTPSAPPTSNLPSVPPESTVAAATTEGTIDLSPNWTEMKRTLRSDWGATCPLDFSCTAADPIDQSPISASFVSVPGQESITVAYVANNPSDDAGAKLDLGHFAMFFSTDSGTQLDFSQTVSDAIDAIAVGGTMTKVYAPLQITVQHPTAAKWQFKIDQAP